MADKGIIFSAPMVRALLDGRKTQTRRLIKLPDEYSRPDMGGWAATTTGGEGVFAIVKGERAPVPERAAIWNQTTGTTIGMPYAAGDRLYVREAWTVRGQYSDVVEVGYRASENRSHSEYIEQWPVAQAVPGKGKWPAWPNYGPSIHMPRWASRMWLAVTDVRVQRLEAITLGDICAEGLASSIYDFKPVQRGFEAWEGLWNSLHTAEGERWQDNPWVVAVSFEVHRGNIDAEPCNV